MDPEKCSEILRNDSKISHDVILMFDEMFLQKSQEFVGGTMVGCNENRELFKGKVCSMIVGLKEIFSIVINAIVELYIRYN